MSGAARDAFWQALMLVPEQRLAAQPETRFDRFALCFPLALVRAGFVGSRWRRSASSRARACRARRVLL
jgi:hypothetical protein